MREMTPAEAQLAAVAEEYRALADRARSLAASAGTTGLMRRTGQGRWSAAQCLIHLTMTTQAYLPLWRDAIRMARTRRLFSGARPLRMDLWGEILLWFLEPPPKVRFPTSNPFAPGEPDHPEGVLQAFLASQDELLGALEEGGDLALDQVKITSPFAQQVRYSAWSSFRIAAAHQRRHLLQAERAARDPLEA